MKTANEQESLYMKLQFDDLFYFYNKLLIWQITYRSYNSQVYFTLENLTNLRKYEFSRFILDAKKAQGA